MKKTNFRISAIVLCITVIFSTSVVFASTTTLMSYSGRGIRDKDSVETFSLSKNTTIHLEHKTTGVQYNGAQPDSKCSLQIALLKKGTFSYAATGDEVYMTGLGAKNTAWTKSSGTYRLHFATKALSETWWPGADIEGRIYK